MIGSVPIYDHVCDHCGHAFSLVQKFSDPPVEACPSCGKRPRRVIAPPAIVFKGSGWYKTDSRAPAAKSKDAAKPEGGAKTEPKSETKAEGKDAGPKPAAPAS